MPHNYVPIYKLLDQWAKQSGELHEVLLTNICEHQSQGRFSFETFRLGGIGVGAPPGALADLVHAIHCAGYNFIRKESAEQFDDTVVSKAGVLSFCKTYDVRPPRCVVVFWRWLIWRGARHNAPPHPTVLERIAAESAVEILEAESANETLERDDLASSGVLKTTVAGESRARRYLENQVSSGNWRPKSEHYSQAQADSGGTLSKRAFERAWHDIVPPEWKKPGRPKTQRNVAQIHGR